MKFNGKTIACGTGFVVASASGKKFFLTARHNVTGCHQETGKPLSSQTAAIPDALSIWHNSSKALGQFVQVDVPLYTNDSPTWIEHPVLRDTADFVAIPVATGAEVALYPYGTEYLSHMHIEPAQTVSVVGFPFGERTGASFAIWATGFVATEPEINHSGRPVFLIDCRSRKGQSGSPVIRYHNGGGLITHDDGTEVISSVTRLLGIYSGRINEESDLGVVWKTHAIAELVDYASTL